MDSALTFGRAPRVPRSRTASCLRFLLTQRMSPARPVTSAAARIAPTTDAIKTAVCRLPLPALTTLPSEVAKPRRSRRLSQEVPSRLERALRTGLAAEVLLAEGVKTH